MTFSVQGLLSAGGPSRPAVIGGSTAPIASDQEKSIFSFEDRRTQTDPGPPPGAGWNERIRHYVERGDQETAMRLVNEESLEIAQKALRYEKMKLEFSREMISDGEKMQAQATALLGSGDSAVRDRARLELDIAKMVLSTGRNSLKEAEASWAEAQARYQPQIDELMALLGMDKAKA